jgi:selenocysteine-specific translation elongation factor
MSGGIASAACLEQEPGTPLRLVNPNFDQAGSSNVLVFLADATGLAQARGECLAVLAQLGLTMGKLFLSGRIDEVVDTIKTNIRHI